MEHQGLYVRYDTGEVLTTEDRYYLLCLLKALYRLSVVDNNSILKISSNIYPLFA
jgi:hypothetical protein